ncbi:MAG: 4-hydroxy-tetrahydrodipicolinate synthase [Bacteroidales bacterium]|nr:4-hydroxy-tetrahydrodipicolinate synthase [Bacteroidales bacterium]
MQSNPFQGTGVALVTPFLNNGEIDTESLKQITRYTLEHGVGFLVVLGTTGESAVLTQAEKTTVLQTILQVNDGMKPVVLGIGGNDTRKVVNTIKSQDLTGIQGILSVTPYYNKPDQSGLFRHFMEVASAADLPVIIYNVPGRTGSNISSETALKLAFKAPNIVAIKEAGGNLDQITDLIHNKPEDFLILSGDDALTLPMMALGADGVISVVANVLPGEMSQMVNLAASGDYQGARKLHYHLIQLIRMLFEEGNPAGVKAALHTMGLCNNVLRLPLTPVSKLLYDRIRAFLK